MLERKFGKADENNPNHSVMFLDLQRQINVRSTAASLGHFEIMKGLRGTEKLRNMSDAEWQGLVDVDEQEQQSTQGDGSSLPISARGGDRPPGADIREKGSSVDNDP